MNEELAAYVELTNLSPVALRAEIIELCRNALEHRFRAVCVHPYYLPLAVAQLRGSGIKPITVVGFPLGANEGAIKAQEAKLAVKTGAAEIDMVINLAALKNGETGIIIEEVAAVVRSGAVVKAIIETGCLTEEEILLACSCILEGGAHFVKTCTGFGPRGVTCEDVSYLRKHLPSEIGIKAAGGIKTATFAWSLIKAGATRLGTSTAVG